MDYAEREVVRSLNYPGDRTADIRVGAVMQHPTFGWYLTVTSVVYDADTGQTHVGFAATTPDDIPEPDPEPAPASGRLGARGPRGKVGRRKR